MTHYQPSPVNKPRRRIWPWVLLAMVLLACGAGAIILGNAAGSTAEAPRITVPDAPSSKAPVKGIPKPSNNPQSIGEGTWVVGEEVKAGKYRSPGAKEDFVSMCYWETSRDGSADAIDEQGVTNAPGEPGRVTLKAGQYFKTSGCEDWVLQK